METKQADESITDEAIDDQQMEDVQLTSQQQKDEFDTKHLSPTKSHETFLKPKSPLGFFKQRIQKKRRESGGGQSEGDSESGSSNVDEERRSTRSGSDSTGPGNLSSSLDSPQQQTPSGASKPRRGIAKVFHDLRFRSKVQKSNSAPANTSMEAGPVANLSLANASSVEVDDISNSSYATPMSGASTPLFSESMITSPESSVTESTEQTDEAEEDEAEKTVQNSPAAENQVNRPTNAETLPVVSSETRPVDETSQKPDQRSSVSTPDEGAQQSLTKALSQHRSSVPSLTRELQDRPASANEIRFCFTEHCDTSPAGSNNNKTSPSRGLIRSLPSDPGEMDQTAGTPGSGYPKNEHLYKVLVIGELGTGKTSIIKRYVHQFFSQHYRATIGVDFALKVVHWDQSTVIRLQLWDIAGQERFGNMTRVYYKEAVGAFIVFDVTRNSTFESVTKWKQDLDTKVQLPDGSPIPCVLLANKCDQPKEGIAAHKAKMDEYCQEKGFVGWFETSAKDNINIDDAAKFLVGRILENDHWSNSTKEDADRLDLHSKAQGEGSGNSEKKKGCC